jgi:hypothetical protein
MSEFPPPNAGLPTYEAWFKDPENNNFSCWSGNKSSVTAGWAPVETAICRATKLKKEEIIEHFRKACNQILPADLPTAKHVRDATTLRAIAQQSADNMMTSSEVDWKEPMSDWLVRIAAVYTPRGIHHWKKGMSDVVTKGKVEEADHGRGANESGPKRKRGARTQSSSNVIKSTEAGKRKTQNPMPGNEKRRRIGNAESTHHTAPAQLDSRNPMVTEGRKSAGQKQIPCASQDHGLGSQTILSPPPRKMELVHQLIEITRGSNIDKNYTVSICAIVQEEYRSLRSEDIRQHHINFEAFKTLLAMYDDTFDLQHHNIMWERKLIKDEEEFRLAIGVQSIRLRQQGSCGPILLKIEENKSRHEN